MAAGAGDLVIDFEFPEPDPPPITTIAWRLGHVIVGIFGSRNASHFGGPPIDYQTIEWPATADDALDDARQRVRGLGEGCCGLDDRALGTPVGAAEGEFAAYPFADLVLHIQREAIHHLAEIALLRDLYRVSH